MATQKNNDRLEVIDWGLLDYGEALKRQLHYVDARLAGETPDRLVMVEHPSVVTLGRSGKDEDLCLPEETLKKNGISFFYSERGGKATCHGPGQLVLYPIIELPKLDLPWYVQTFLLAVSKVLSGYGIDAVSKARNPGLWVNSKKIASIGISIKKQISFHGAALNVNNDLSLFDSIIPCGHPNEVMTSMAAEIRSAIDITEVKTRAVRSFVECFSYQQNFND